jgi:hypothetical protein
VGEATPGNEKSGLYYLRFYIGDRLGFKISAAANGKVTYYDILDVLLLKLITKNSTSEVSVAEILFCVCKTFSEVLFR